MQFCQQCAKYVILSLQHLETDLATSVHRQSSLLDKESDVEEQEEDTAAESEPDVDGNPTRDIKLRPRKRVSFKLDDVPSADDAFQVGTLRQSSAICG